MLGRVTLHAEAIHRVTISANAAICVLTAEQTLHVRRALLTAGPLTEVVPWAAPLLIALRALDRSFCEAPRDGGESDEEQDEGAHGVACIRERGERQA